MADVASFWCAVFASRPKVVSFRGQEALSDLYSFGVRVLVPRAEARTSLDRATGARATLELGAPERNGRVVRGIISSVDVVEALDAEWVVVELTLVPTLFRASLRRASRVFVDQSVREITETVLRRAGIEIRFALRQEPAKREMCVQYEETDLAFVLRLLAEEGIFFFFFELGDEQELMVIADEASAYPAIDGDPKLRFRGTNTDAMMSAEDVIGPFRRAHHLRSSAVLHRSFDFRRPHLEVAEGFGELEGPLLKDRPSKGCGCAEMNSAMGSLLVADANKGMVNIHGNMPFYATEQPYWSNLFAYTLPDAFSEAGATVLNVVRNDKKQPRELRGMVRRYPVRTIGGILGGPLDATTKSADEPMTLVKRVARQGPFDNVHLAPRMAMKLGGNAAFVERSETRFHRIDTSAWKTEEVVMAPFCAHDCFHMHWRWADVATDRWTTGWTTRGPYTEAGAAMIPLNQELDLRMRSERQIAYIARAVNVPPNSEMVFCHHGAAYALTTGDELGPTRLPFTATTGLATARHGVENNTLPLTGFADGTGRILTASSSWAVFYWQLRYDIVIDGGTPKPRERVQIDNKRDLFRL